MDPKDGVEVTEVSDTTYGFEVGLDACSSHQWGAVSCSSMSLQARTSMDSLEHQRSRFTSEHWFGE